MSPEGTAARIEMPPLPGWLRVSRWLGGLFVTTGLFLMVWLTSQVGDPEPPPMDTFRSESVVLPPPPPLEKPRPEAKREKPMARKLEPLREDSPQSIRLLEVEFEPEKEEELVSKLTLDLSSFDIDMRNFLDEQIFERSEVDEGPEPLYRAEPNVKSTEGKKVSFRAMFIVNTKGKVEQAYIIDSTLPSQNEEVLRTVKQWVFRPAIKDGKPVNQWVRIRINVTPSSGSPFSI